MLNENNTIANLKHCYNKNNQSSLFATSPRYTIHCTHNPSVKYVIKHLSSLQVPSRRCQSQTRSHGPRKLRRVPRYIHITCNNGRSPPTRHYVYHNYMATSNIHVNLPPTSSNITSRSPSRQLPPQGHI